MAGDIKDKYIASVSPTVTNLHSLASSQDWTAGWCSAAVNNTTNCYLDYMYAGTFTTHASNRQAGVINVYVIPSLNDTPTWPATASGTIGTEGALSFADTEERDAVCVPIASITVDNSGGAIYPMVMRAIASYFNGEMPSHHAIFISHNCSTTTTAGLAAAGSALYYTPKTKQYT